jgi:integrase
MTIISKEFQKKTKNGSRKITRYRYAVTYKDVYGKSKRYYSKWYDRKSDCVKAEAEYRNKPIPNKLHIKFIDVAEAFLKAKKDTISIRTYKKYDRYIHREFTRFYDMDIDSITPLALKEYFDNLECAATTKNNRRSAMKGVFRYACDFYGLEKNPMERIPCFKVQNTAKKHDMNIYTPKEFMALYNAISPKYEDVKVFLWFLYWTGMRANEARSLTWNDIDGNVVHIHRQWINGAWHKLKTRQSIRDVTIDSKTLELILSLKEKQMKSKHYKDDWFVFGGAFQLPYSSMSRIKDEGCDSAGLRRIRIHDLRHSHVSYLISKGVNIYTISRRVGHSSITMTMDVYGHLLPSSQDEVLKAIEIEN